jgi:8-oxo-dGTP pyrophosphatase MutT (NUDIX family)
MRRSEAAVALVQLTRGRQSLWLARWNTKWQRYHFVAGHRTPDETFRECLVREIAEELHLIEGPEYLVSTAPPVHLEFNDYSESARTQTHYVLELFRVEPSSEVLPKVESGSENRWLTESEVRARRAGDGRPVSATMSRVLEATSTHPMALTP